MYENIHTQVLDLRKPDVINTGGLCSIKFFRWEDVETWPIVNPQTSIIEAALQLKPGKSIYICEATAKERTLKEEEKFEAAGPYMEIVVSAKLAGNTIANTLSLQSMMFHHYGLIVHDRNGEQRLIGNEDSGARFRFDYDAGNLESSRMRNLEWAWQNVLPAPVYVPSYFNIGIGTTSGTTTTVSAGCLTLISRFRVGDPGAPMNDGDDTFTHAALAGKQVLVIASSMLIPVDDGSGAINWSGSIERHVIKILNSNSITFHGGVVEKEIIEIYAY